MGAHCYSLLGNPTQKSKTQLSAYGDHEEFNLWGHMPSQPFWLPRELVDWLWAPGLVGRFLGAPDAQVPFSSLHQQRQQELRLDAGLRGEKPGSGGLGRDDGARAEELQNQITASL